MSSTDSSVSSVPDPGGCSKDRRRALILVVERNPVVQRLKKVFLEQAGYTVEFVTDGVSALARARELRPKILVTEILVPKLDGLNLCRALKSDPSTREILVLLFSHLHAEDRAREVGADAFLIKPLNEQLLIETVQELIAIASDGIELFPRLVTPAVAPAYTERMERVNTGIAGLDGMIAEGFWRGTTTLVAGPTGSGKTIMGLHFITHGALTGEPGLYVGLQENPVQLSRAMQSFGWNPGELLGNGGFELMYRSPVEMKLDSIASEVFQRVRAGTVKRVVIDALGDLERSSVDRQRFADFIYSLTQWFAAEGVTCLMMYELTELFEVHGISDQEISNMSDNIILLRFTSDNEMERTIRIIKTRGSAHDNREHTLRITKRGIEIKS